MPEEIQCRACGTVYDRYDVRCPSCGTVTTKANEEERRVCHVCRLFAGVSIALLLFWLYVFITQAG